VKYWLHSGMLTINGEKMAKSLGNFIPIKKLLQNYHPDVYRLFLLTKHYRKPVDYNKQALIHAENSLKRIVGAVKSLKDQIKKVERKNVTKKDRKFKEETEKLRRKFIDAMDDDFNTPKALAEYYELIRLSNIAVSEDVSKDTLKIILKNIEDLSEVFGLLQEEKAITQKELPEDAKFLIEEREKARKEKNWEKADEIRAQLAKRGIILIDSSKGTEWRIK
jgi:cysteinyl-tRNA synthetase